MEFGPTQRSVLLPTKKSEKNMEVTIGAWGSEGFRKPIHNNLQKLDASVMLADTCQTYHHFIMKIHKHEICTLIKRGTGMCNVCNTVLYLVECSNVCTFNFMVACLLIFLTFSICVYNRF